MGLSRAEQGDGAAAERLMTKALGGENHPAPRVINNDKHAGYPPAIAKLQTTGDLAENSKSKHRPVQYLNNYPGTGSPGHQAPDPRQSTFSLLLGSLAHDRRLRGRAHDPQRPGRLDCGGCEGRSAPSLYCWYVRIGSLIHSVIAPSCLRFQSCNTTDFQIPRVGYTM